MHGADGQQIGAYRLEARLGQGTFGAVYRARHLATGAERALKLLGPTRDATERLRFRREAELQAQLDQHPNVLRVHEAGEWRGQDYLVLDYAAGGSLAELLRRGPLPVERAVEIAVDLARALGHLHAHGVLHRDLKPANVLFDERGYTKLADFGLARGASNASLTASGAVLGSPMYMAPEQANGTRDLTPAADLYALGGVLYTLLAGRAPFPASSVLALLNAVLNSPPEPLGSVCPGVDPRLAELVHRCLEKDPSQRPPSAKAVEQALLAIQRPDADEGPGRAPLTGVAVVAALTLAALAGGVAYLTRAAKPPTEPHATTPPADPPPAPPPAALASAPLVAALQADDPVGAQGAWDELEGSLGELTPSELGALHPIALRAGLTALEARDARKRDFPPLTALCCEVVAALDLRTQAATTELSSAVLREATRRARAARGDDVAEADALAWSAPACQLFDAHQVPVVDAEALAFLDEVWSPGNMQHADNAPARAAVTLSLVSAGVLPGPDHVLRLLRQRESQSPLRTFLVELDQLTGPQSIDRSAASSVQTLHAAAQRLQRLLDDYGDELSPRAKTLLEVWIAHGERDAGARVRALRAATAKIQRYQARLGFTAALACLSQPTRDEAHLAEGVELAKALAARLDTSWIVSSAHTNTLDVHSSEALCALLLTHLAARDEASFQQIYADCPRTTDRLLSDRCPNWLKPALERATAH
ncbi:MAG: serine/threonine protein kinase [Planctomycetes bacterium]|nr:serine/threonine protein kinase [Planctomycetota bacterium]